MKKENLKTIILTLLIFSSVILSVQIWFQNPVWSENNNPLSYITKWFKREEGLNITDTGALGSVFSPRSFVFTYNDGRIIFSTTEEEGSVVRNIFNDAIKNALSVSSDVAVEESDWQSMLKSNSIYADYSVPVSTSAMYSFLGGSSSPSFPLSSFDKAVITLDSISKNAYICLRNSEDNAQIRVPVVNSASLNQIYEKYIDAEKESYAYAFEMNLDKKMDDHFVHQTVLIDSYVLIPVESVRMNTIRSQKVEFDQDAIDEILALFGYNPKSVRKYTESNGNILFIDSSSTLKLHPATGYIEYTSTESDALSLLGDGKLSSVASGCGKLIDDIFKLFSIDKNVTLFINSPLNNDSATDYTITFDYLFAGNRIKNADHSCKIVISNGKIRSFYANVKNYVKLSDTNEENALDVLGNLYSSLNQETLVINSLFTGYTDKQGEMSLEWQVMLDKSDEILTVATGEQQ